MTIIEKGTIVATYCATEPEAWFLGRTVEPMWTAKSAARGFRGESLKEKKGTKYLTVSKIQECIGGTHFFEEGLEGQVIVPAENVICIGVEVIHKGMPRFIAETALGEHWESLSNHETRDILASEFMYLGLPQRELIWSKSPQ